MTLTTTELKYLISDLSRTIGYEGVKQADYAVKLRAKLEGMLGEIQEAKAAEAAEAIREVMTLRNHETSI